MKTSIERLMEKAEADPKWKVILPAAINAIGGGIESYKTGWHGGEKPTEAERIAQALEVAAETFLILADSHLD